MTDIRISLRFGAVSALAVCSGCMIPTYHMPAGFSSTYHNAVEKSQEATEVFIDVPAAPPGLSSPEPKTWTSRFSRRGL